MIYKFRSQDHPHADGKPGKVGQAVYAFTIPLEDKRTLELELGETMMQFLVNSYLDIKEGTKLPDPCPYCTAENKTRNDGIKVNRCKHQK